MSSLLFGLATYSFFGGGAFRGGVGNVGIGKDCLGARDHVDADELDRAESVREWENEIVLAFDADDMSEPVGDNVPSLTLWLVCARGREGGPVLVLTGVE